MVAVLLVVIAPLWIVRFNPLVDYPMHLARAYVLKEYEHVNFFQRQFDRAFAPIPNLAIDLIVPPFSTYLLLRWLEKYSLA